jgi:hypothetical protein
MAEVRILPTSTAKLTYMLETTQLRQMDGFVEYAENLPGQVRRLDTDLQYYSASVAEYMNLDLRAIVTTGPIWKVNRMQNKSTKPT